MRILILNWRDIKNPLAGGAEILTHEVAVRMVKQGHKVSIITARFNGGKEFETIDGVDIYRRGKPQFFYFFNSVYFQAMLLYLSKFKNKVDYVIDEVHGLPFFTPFYVKEKKAVLACEVAREMWDMVLPFPLNQIGKIAEKIYFKLYKNTPFLAISESTKKDILDEGIRESLVSIIPMGINRVKIKTVSKEKNPTMIYVGRISKTKGIEDAITVCKNLKKEYGSIKLWLVGRGDNGYISKLKIFVKTHGLEKNVEFTGFVNDAEKFSLMSGAHIIMVTSMREGFGLIVPEAGSVHTPAVVYDVPGLTDLVKNGYNGFKVPYKDIKKMTEKILHLFCDRVLYEKISDNAYKSSLTYNWDKTSAYLLKFIKEDK